MTIWRKENPVPTRLPAARLYLEDLEEMISIFLHAGDDREPESPAVGNIEFRIGKERCDQIEDLPKIVRRTTEFEMDVTRREGDNHRLAKGLGVYEVHFGISKYSTQWTTFGLTKEEAWAVFRKLEVIFEKRKFRWSIFNNGGSPFGQGLAFGAAVLLFVFGLEWRSIHVSALTLLLTTVTLGILLQAKFSHHSVLFLSNSWDHMARRQELRNQIIAGVVPALVGATLGIAGTLLAGYLRHKYWP